MFSTSGIHIGGRKWGLERIGQNAGGVRRSGLFFLIPLLCVACTPARDILDTVSGTGNQPAEGARSYAIYLVGDAGLPEKDATGTALSLLGRMIKEEGPNSAVVFLGDNIYENGMPDPESPDRAEAERRIDVQLAAVSGHDGQVVFIPGNHDWGGRGLGGNRSALRRQEVYVENALDKGNAFLPDHGFAGPVEVFLNDEITLVVLDTQWWLEPEKPMGDTGLYELDQIGTVLVELEDILRRNEGKRIVVVGHHPLFSDGEHAGYFPATLSPISLIRRFMGTPQDFSNYSYRRLRLGLLSVLNKHEGVIYAAGHEHSLQYIKEGDQHYIVSGSGTKSDYVNPRGRASYAASEHGFARLMFYTDGSVWVEFWAPVPGSHEGRRLHVERLESATRPLTPYHLPRNVEGEILLPGETAVVPLPDGDKADGEEEAPNRSSLPDASKEPYAFFSKDTVTVQAGDYDIPAAMNWLLGARYRVLWKSPIEVPVIDLDKTAGGLSPIKRGGGFQTTSLRLRGEDGDQYVLRSVNKDASAVLPDFLRDTLVDDFVEDQTSAMHPFAAFVVPPLAEAAGIYHTMPRLVVIPDDERLGIYREEFAGTLALFEMRPDENQRDEGRFGQPENIIGSPRLFEKLLESSEQRVDARFYVRSRLLDMFLGDWDRHQDQWRWAEFEPYELDPTLEGPDRTRGKIYRSIPRDRDFVFFKPEGLISDIAQMVGGPRLRLSTFGPKINHLKGLNLSASNLDKQFTSPLTKDDWISIATELRDILTDEVIEQAVEQMPPSAFEMTGPEIIENLKRRRDQLPDVAARYYKMLAQKVEIVGSNENEEFIVRRIDDETTEIVVLKASQDDMPGIELFRRTFYEGETREVHLYGLGGLDRFVFQGRHENGIVIRAVGGYGMDTYVQEDERVQRVHVYDTPGPNVMAIGRPHRIHLSTDPEANIYSSRRFGRRNVLPAVAYDLNSEDGIFLGGGVRFKHQGFLHFPYRSTHEILFRQSLFTRAFNVTYGAHFPRGVGPWDSRIDAEFLKFNNIRNFYGIGNNTDGSTENRQRFRAQYSQLTLEPHFVKHLSFFQTVNVGLRMEYTNVDRIPGGAFPGTEASGYSAEDLREKIYLGVRASFNVDGTDTLVVTRSGARWLNAISLNQGVHNTDWRYLSVTSDLSYFYSFNASGSLTIAFRVGAGRNFGKYEFYQAHYLSGRSNLRGYEKNRFAGHTNFYNNIELRAALLRYNAYLLTGELGVLGFFDHGRVWSDVKNGGPWHAGYGGGVWMIPFSSFIVNATYGVSREGPVLDFFLRFLF